VPDIYVTLNARLQPLDRGERFEDPLVELLADKLRDVDVSGGGTLLNEKREPSTCDIDLSVKGNPDEALRVIVAALERLGAPKGSVARVGGADRDKEREVKFGVTEGIAIYLNGADLPDEAYQTNDVNELVARLDASLGDAGQMYSHWQGPTETALYYYGPSAARMRELVAAVLGTHPLGQLSRVEQIAP
jgi:hypothetical protein